MSSTQPNRWCFSKQFPHRRPLAGIIRPAVLASPVFVVAGLAVFPLASVAQASPGEKDTLIPRRTEPVQPPKDRARYSTETRELPRSTHWTSLYDVKFETTGQMLDAPPAVGAGSAPRDMPSSIWYGEPLVVGQFNLLASQPCVFGRGEQIGDLYYEQLAFATRGADGFPESYDTYLVQMDLALEDEWANEDYLDASFSLILDAKPDLIKFRFCKRPYEQDPPEGYDARIEATSPLWPASPGTLGTFDFGASFTFQIYTDVVNDWITVRKDGAVLYSDHFPMSGVDGVRVNMELTQVPDAAGVDNVSIIGGDGSGDCCYGHDYPGCGDPICENAVCESDAHCCEVMWDSVCASQTLDREACDCGEAPGGGGGEYEVNALDMSWTGDTCQEVNDCHEYNSHDAIYEVWIPFEGIWLFQLCQSLFDTRLLVGTFACGWDIGESVSGCMPPGNTSASALTLHDLPAGTYYATIEGQHDADCGDYTLEIEALSDPEHKGACCVGQECSRSITTEQQCEQTPRGVWHWDETCPGYHCPPVPETVACCRRKGAICTNVLSWSCLKLKLDDEPAIPGESGSACGNSTLACCLGDGSMCVDADTACCQLVGGWLAPGDQQACLGDSSPANGIDDACDYHCSVAGAADGETILNFGTVVVGGQEDRQFTITNTGAGTLEGTVSESCDYYSIAPADGSNDYSLGTDQSEVFTVSFQPEEPGVWECTIDPGNACDEITCTGQTQCLVSPASLDLGSARVGEEGQCAWFTITNVGQGTLSGTVSASTSCDPNFSIRSGSGSYDLDPDGVHDVEVCFHPISLGDLSCAISTGGSCPDVGCTGTASEVLEISVGQLTVTGDNYEQDRYDNAIWKVSSDNDADVWINDLIRLTGTVTANTSTFTVSGEGEIWIDGVPVLEDVRVYDGKWQFDAQDAATTTINEVLSALKVVGLGVRVSHVAIQDSSIRLQGRLVMPSLLDGAKLEISGEDYIELSKSDGLEFSGATMEIPDIDGMALFDLPFGAENVVIHVSSDEVQVRGQLELGELLGGTTIDLSTELNHIAITQEGGQPHVDIVGVVSMEGPILVGPGFSLEDMEFTLDTIEEIMRADGTLNVPAGYGIIVGVGFREGYFDYVHAGVDDLGIVIITGPPPASIPIVYWQRVEAELRNLAPGPPPIILGGEMEFTGGPEVGGRYLVALVVGAEYDTSGRFTATGVVLLGGGDDPYKFASAMVILDTTYGLYIEGELKYPPVYSVLIVTGRARVGLDNSMQAKLTGEIQIPSDVFVIGGIRLGDVTLYGQAYEDGDDSNDYFIAAVSVKILWKTFKRAVKFNIHNGAINWNASMDLINEVDVPPGTRITLPVIFNIAPGFDEVILQAEWDSGDTDLLLCRPGCTPEMLITPENVGGFFDVAYLKEGSKAMYSVIVPEPGEWQVDLTNPGGIGGYVIQQLGTSTRPSITLVEPLTDTSDTLVNITWTDADDDDDATVTLYYDTDRDGADGTVIVSGISEDNDGMEGAHTWDTTGVPIGAYYVYAKIDDGKNAPVIDYSLGRVVITGPTARGAPGNLAAVAGEHSGEVRLSWTAGGGDVHHYVVALTTDPAGETYESLAGGSDETSTLLPGLVPGQQYRLAVAAVDADRRTGPFSTPIIVTVTDTTNNAPVFTGEIADRATAQEPYSSQVLAVDIDDQTISYDLVGEPPDMTIDTNGAILWEPNEDQVGAHTFDVLLDDRAGGTSQRSFIVHVAGSGLGNRPPKTLSRAPALARPETLYSYQLVVDDPDPSEVLSYDLLVWPAGATVSGSGLIEYDVPAGSGWYEFFVRVQDDEGLYDVQRFTIQADADSPALDVYDWGTVTASAIDAIEIEAKGAYDATGLTEFLLKVDGVEHGPWQLSPKWTVADLSPDSQYEFQIKIRDASQDLNESDWSEVLARYTLAKVPPSPKLVLAEETALNLSLYHGANPPGTELALWNVSHGEWVTLAGTGSSIEVWADAVTWGTVAISDLAVDTVHHFQIKARNGEGVKTALSEILAARTLGPSSEAPLSLPRDWVCENPPGQTDNEVTLTASFDSDPYENSSYTFTWTAPVHPVTGKTMKLLVGGGPGDQFAEYAAPEAPASHPLPYQIKCTITGNDEGNYVIATALVSVRQLPPPGDDCDAGDEAGAIEITDGSYLFSNRCATTDGPDSVPSDAGTINFGRDLWYKYVTTCTGRLHVSTCATGYNFDSAVAVYHDSRPDGDPTACPCPGEPGFMQDGLGNDEGCSGIADGGAGELTRAVGRGECWLIRVGGYESHMGDGQLDVSCAPGMTCCTGQTCDLTETESECADNGGYWLAPPNVETSVASCGTPPDYSDNPCLEGSCCRSWYECLDESEPTGEPMTWPDCDILGGEFIGGAKCDNPRRPCPVCPIQRIDRCRMFGELDDDVRLSDLSAPSGATVVADDFILRDSTISQVCVWGAYLDGSRDDGEFGCSEDVTDDFRVTIYEDGGGLPGAMVGTSTVSEPVRGEEPGTFYEEMYLDNTGEPMFTQHLQLDTPITGILRDRCYWLEVVNNTPEPDPDQPPNSCEWHWAATDTGSGYSFAGTWYGDVLSPDPYAGAVYADGGARANNMVFCIDADFEACGDVAAACCSCPDEGPECATTTYDACSGTDRLWTAERPTCTGYDCAEGPPPGDDCDAGDETGAVEITDGSYLFHSQCADTDGPDTVPTDSGDIGFGSDLWYHYTTTCTGLLQVSMCGTMSNFDSALVLYHDSRPGGGPTVCPCPGDTGFIRNGPGADETCNGIADGGAGTATRTVTPGECWTIAVGGYNAVGGDGQLNVQCLPASCPLTQPPVDDPGLSDFGSGTRNRYLGFLPTNEGQITAIRVTLTALPSQYDYAEGRTAWLGQPFPVSESSGNPGGTPPPTFWAAGLQCDPYYTDWSTYDLVQVHDQAIAPSATYALQAIHDYCPPGAESSYSAPLIIDTSKWGDLVSVYATCRWGPPNSFADFDDIVSVVDKFKNLPCAPKKSRVDIAPNVVDGVVDFVDIPFVIDAFRGLPYPFPGPPISDPCW